jgi:hypothetical protein
MRSASIAWSTTWPSTWTTHSISRRCLEWLACRRITSTAFTALLGETVSDTVRRLRLHRVMPHEVLRKWLFIDSTREDFESTMEAVAKQVARNDPHFGVLLKSPKPKRRKH